MPLDGHSYLVSQGWGGKGTALREGAISRPITIAQKKNLAGLGKDRDEAFPFWDHLFNAAAKSIQIKYTSDDEDEDDSDSSTTAAVTLTRTSTGILSTRRPVEGTPAASGSTTPSTDAQPPPHSRLSLVTQAKREAAKRGLYSRFFRGPIIGPEAIEAEEKRLTALVSEAFDKQNSHVEKMTITQHIEVETEDHERMVVDLEVSKAIKYKKRSHGNKEGGDEEDEEERRSRKKRRKEEKRRKAEDEETAGIPSTSKNMDKKRKSKSKDSTKTMAIPPDQSTRTERLEGMEGRASTSKGKNKRLKSKSKTDATAAALDTQIGHDPSIPAAGEKVKESKEERARRKEEKRRLRTARPLAGSGDINPSMSGADSSKSSKLEKSSKSSRQPETISVIANTSEKPTRKKRRRSEE